MDKIKNTLADSILEGGMPSPTDIQQRLALAQLRKLEKEDADLFEREEQLKKFRLMNALEAKKKSEELLMIQAMCNHRKPNNASAVVGYRSHQHVEQWICQNCFKEWFGHEVPPMLRPPREKVGGPL